MGPSYVTAYFVITATHFILINCDGNFCCFNHEGNILNQLHTRPVNVSDARKFYM